MQVGGRPSRIPENQAEEAAFHSSSSGKAFKAWKAFKPRWVRSKLGESFWIWNVDFLMPM